MNGERTGPLLKMEVTLSAVLIALGLFGNIAFWAIQKGTDVGVTKDNLTSFETAISQQLAQLQTHVDSGLGDVHRQIEGLPDQRAELAQIEHRLGEDETRVQTDETRTETRAQTSDARIRAAEQATIQLRSDLDNVVRASNAALPGARR